MFGASALYHRGNWSPTTAKRLLQLDHTAIFLHDRGHVHADRAARDGRHRARGDPRRGLGRRRRRDRLRVDADPGAARLRDHRVHGARLDRRVLVRPAVRGDRLGGRAPDRRRRPALHDRRDRARGPQARPVARDVRLPRDLPRVRDPRRAAALLRDRVPRAAARRERLRPRAPEPRVLGRRRRRLPGRARAAPRRRRRGACGSSPSRSSACSATCAASTCSSSAAATRGGRCTSRPTAHASSPSTSRRGQLRHARALSDATQHAPCHWCARAGRRSRWPSGIVRPRVLRPRRDVVLRPRPLGGRGGAAPAPGGAWCSRTRRRGRTSRGTSPRNASADGCGARTSACVASTTARATGTVDFQLPYGEWIRCFRRHGLVVDDLVELRAPKQAATSYDDFDAAVGAALARRADLGHPQASVRPSGQQRVPARGSSPVDEVAGDDVVDALVAVVEAGVLLARRPRAVDRARARRPSDRACASGVAGSSVVPITRIGGAPAAVRRPTGGDGRHRPHRARQAVVHDERAHPRRDRHRLALERGRGVDVADHGPVEARHRPERLEHVVVATVVGAPDERVGAREQRRRVTFLGVGQRVGQTRTTRRGRGRAAGAPRRRSGSG